MCQVARGFWSNERIAQPEYIKEDSPNLSGRPDTPLVFVEEIVCVC